MYLAYFTTMITTKILQFISTRFGMTKYCIWGQSEASSTLYLRYIYNYICTLMYIVCFIVDTSLTPEWCGSILQFLFFDFILRIHTLSTPSEIGLMRMMLDPTEEELIFGSDNVLVPSGELMLMYWGAIYVHISWNVFFIQHILNLIKCVFTIAAWC